MTTGRRNVPIVPVPKVFTTLDEIGQATTKIRRRVADVEKLRDEKIRHDDERVHNVEAAISKTILEVFGPASPEYQRHQHYGIVRAWPMNAPDAVYQRNFEEALPDTLTMLEGLIDSLDESAEDLRYSATRGAQPSAAPNSAGRSDDILPVLRKGAFDSDLTRYFQEALESTEPLALVIVDLDHFKSVNDTHGHPIGDEVLLAVAGVLDKRTRRKGNCYRYGGEEFAILLPNYGSREALTLAEVIRSEIESAELTSKKLKVTASFGIACTPEHCSDSRELLGMADAALYEAKNLGRNLVRVSGEPRPVAGIPRALPRREPVAGKLTEQQQERIRLSYFRKGFAVCPNDQAQLVIRESHRIDRATPDLFIGCPVCGLHEQLHGQPLS